MAGSVLRSELENELIKLNQQETILDNELREFFTALKSGGTGRLNNFDSASMFNSVNKIEQFAPVFEAMIQDSKKLASQVEDGRSISDKMSMIIRRLDLMQIRAQQALACTEDIINLKECKIRMLKAMEDGNLPQAVSYIRQVHDIDVEAAKSSDDYNEIMNAEKDLRELVRKEFIKAMEDSNVNSVVSLCPLLQTLGLETEARDNFLDFMERTVFIAVSADACSVDGATDPATGYAQAISNIFNSSFVILQRYLPMVIQGLESSYGDIYFIRRLHSKCEIESGSILKRYMKYRNIKDIITSTKTASCKVTSAEMHVILDELALLIQYSCSYSKYIKQLCIGAETRKRPVGESQNTASPIKPMVVFSGPTEFDKMVDELINKYYMEGEKWIMKLGVKTALNLSPDNEGGGLDECFFVLQRCSQRALATNNIHAACAVLRLVSDLLSSDLLNKAADNLSNAANKIGTIIQDQMTRYIKSATNDGNIETVSGATLSKGLKSAISLASSITRVKGTDNEDDTRNGNTDDDEWGVSSSMQVFNIVETCIRYTDRLNRDIWAAGMSVFGTTTDNITSPTKPGINKDVEKLKLCKEDFDAAKMAFAQTLRHGAERMLATPQKLIKEILVHTFSRNGPLGGVKFDIHDDRFESQPAVALLPRMLIIPFEAIANISTSNLSDTNKDMIIGMLADAVCERIEHFISQTSFRFAGSLKFEECVRAIITLFTRLSTTPIRGKFSRLREIMSVLTSDVTSTNTIADTFTYLTINEVKAFVALRVDAAD